MTIFGHFLILKFLRTLINAILEQSDDFNFLRLFSKYYLIRVLRNLCEWKFLFLKFCSTFDQKFVTSIGNMVGLIWAELKPFSKLTEISLVNDNFLKNKRKTFMIHWVKNFHIYLLIILLGL